MISKLNCDTGVKIFLLDILVGSLSMVFLILLFISIFVLRTRRSIGPLLLLLSSIIGVAGSMLFILDKTEVLDTPDIIQLVLFVVCLAGASLSLVLWRKR